LNSVVGYTHFRPLSSHACYRKFINLLPERFRRAFAFVYIRNETLFVALSHPGYKMELNYNKELLKSLLSTLGTHDEKCRFMSAREVVFFVSNVGRKMIEIIWFFIGVRTLLSS
jgi:hypothetical protein